MKKCSQCGKIKPKEEYSKNRRMKDRLSKICKKCASENNRKYREKQKEKFGEEEYLRLEWEKNLRRMAEKEGIPLTGVVPRRLNIKMIHFPDPAFPLSMSYIEFMRKYKLSVEEFFLLREKVRRGKFVVE